MGFTRMLTAYAEERCRRTSSPSLPLFLMSTDRLNYSSLQLDQPSGYVIGMASILENTPTHLRAEIGDMWLTPAFRGTYAGLEAGQLLLRFLFETLG